jgi:hypothetical protein
MRESLPIAIFFCNAKCCAIRQVAMKKGDEGPEHSEEDDDEGRVSLDKEIVFIVKLHETLVSGFDVSPVSISMRRDPDFGFSGGDFLLEYDLGYGDTLIVACKREGGNMLISLSSSGKEFDSSVPLDQYVDDDFMPVVDEEFTRLVQDWFE